MGGPEQGGLSNVGLSYACWHVTMNVVFTCNGYLARAGCKGERGSGNELAKCARLRQQEAKWLSGAGRCGPGGSGED